MFRVKLILMHIYIQLRTKYIFTKNMKIPYKITQLHKNTFVDVLKFYVFSIFFINCISIIKLILQVTKAI